MALKKIIAAITAIIIMISSSACSQADNTPEIKLEKQRNCVINYLGKDYNCTLSFLSGNVESVTLNSPDTLSGLSFRYSNGKYTISLGSLICRSESLMIPDDSFPAAVSKLMKELRKNKENIKLIQSENGFSYSSASSIPYTVKTDNNGHITNIMFGNL